MKKTLSLMLVLVMLLVQFTIPTFAEDSEDDYVEDPYAGLKITSISAEAGRTLIQNCDGDWSECFCNGDDGEGYFRYIIFEAEPMFTVVYEDGSEESGMYYELIGDMSFEDDQCENHWGLGKHTVTATYRDTICEFQVEVVETPVESLVAIPQKPLVEGWDSYEDYYYDENDEPVPFQRFDPYEAESIFTVTFKDGTVITGDEEEIFKQTGYYPIAYDEQEIFPFEIGKNPVMFDFMGAMCSCEVEVVANPYKAVEISGTNELVVKFIGLDDSVYETKFVDYSYVIPQDGGFLIEFVDEKGETYSVVYQCAIDENEEYILNKDVSLFMGSFTTNTLEINNWLVARIAIEQVAYCGLSYKQVCAELCGHEFEGIDITDDNVCPDDLIALSTYLCDTDVESEDDTYYNHQLGVQTVRNNIDDVFGPIDVDVIESKFYDGETDTIVLKEPVYIDGYFECYEFGFNEDNWTFGAFIYTYSEETEDFEKTGMVTVVMNSDFEVQSIDFTTKTAEIGDVNGDGKISAIDARMILQKVAETRTFTDEQIARMDVDGSGSVTAVDARCVLQFVASAV